MRPQGIQDEAAEHKEEKSHVRSMTDECISKAAKPKASATTRANKKADPVEEGTLSRQSLAKLDATVNRINTAFNTMQTQLECAAKSTCIAPMLISNLSAVASGLYAETSSLALYRSNNKEVDTGTVIEQAKEKLDSAVKEFNVLKKLLKAEELITMPHENVPGSVPDVD